MPWGLRSRSSTNSMPTSGVRGDDRATTATTDQRPGSQDSSSPQKMSTSTLRQPTLATQPTLEATAPLQPAMLSAQQRTDSDRSNRSRRRLTASLGSIFGGARERRDSNKGQGDGAHSSGGSSDGLTSTTEPGSPVPPAASSFGRSSNDTSRRTSREGSPAYWHPSQALHGPPYPDDTIRVVTESTPSISSGIFRSRAASSPTQSSTIRSRAGSLFGPSRRGSNAALSNSSPLVHSVSPDSPVIEQSQPVRPETLAATSSPSVTDDRQQLSVNSPSSARQSSPEAPSRESISSAPSSSFAPSSEALQQVTSDTPPSSVGSQQPSGSASIQPWSTSSPAPLPQLQLASALLDRRSARNQAASVSERPGSINSTLSQSVDSHDDHTEGHVGDSVDSNHTMHRPTDVASRMRTLPRLESYTASDARPRSETLSTAEGDEDDEEDDDGGEAGASGSDDTEDGDAYESATEGDRTGRPEAPQRIALATLSRGDSAAPARERSRSGSRMRTPMALTSSSSFAAGFSSQAAGPSQGGWVQFATVTPTPGPMRSTRLESPDNHSYFDLPSHLTSGATGQTPGRPLATPFAPQSLSSVARGKRPLQQNETSSTQVGPSTPFAADLLRISPKQDQEHALEQYRRRSQSVVALTNPVMFDDEDDDRLANRHADRPKTSELHPIWQRAGVSTPGPSWLTSSASASYVRTPAGAPGSEDSPARSPGATRTQRRRSMYELHDAPPLYVAEYQRPGESVQKVFPREEEGKENLPDYTCAVHIEGYMPRKMEFSAPAVQSKDRAWKRQYVVVHGTSIKIYRYDLRTHPISGEQDWSRVTAEIAGKDGPPPLHFHEGEYGAEPGASSKFPISIGDARSKAKHSLAAHSTGGAPNGNRIVRHYSLQNAESGLAADYVKRKHVVRVRAEGEQFLLQAKDDRGVIDLIEALQAATNVALDLDQRQLPKLITLPRRRRRRRRVVDATATASASAADATPAADASNAGEAGATGEGSTADGVTRSHAASESRINDMLAEEQHAYSRGGGGATVM